MSRESIVVVGGGISGLSAAWELSGGAQGPNDTTPRIELIEFGAVVGGSLATTEFSGRTIDLGADGFLARRPEAVDLVRELGCDDQLEAIDASGASLWLRGALDELPTGLVLGIPTSSGQLKTVRGLSWRARLEAQRDEIAPVRMRVGDDATIGDIVRTKLGRELCYQFVEPMLGGIQAGRIDDLSARSVFPALLDAARKGGSLMRAMRTNGPATPGPTAPSSNTGPTFVSLLAGVGSLPLEIARQLRQRGVVVRTGVAVTALRRTPSGNYPWEIDTYATTTPADAVVVATPGDVTARLLGAHDVALAQLERVPSAGAAMITFSVAPTLTLPAGTGILVPLDTSWSGDGSMMTTAVTFLDRKWPHLRRDDDVLLRAHVGRIDDARWSEMSDEQLVARVSAELRVLLPTFTTPIDALVQRWPNALPQYRLGHESLVANARAAAATLGVTLCGNAYDGVGIPASVGSGRRAGREALEMVQLSYR
ncbi:MAG TPA: protoporphyrinogen oxidase [Acidimicrobiales bacterium]|nr:protoporphyrinogen oxidase [Acidimicrobiales bacterium]